MCLTLVKSSSLEVHKSSDSVEAPNNILTSEIKKLIRPIGFRIEKPGKRKKKNLILGDYIVKDTEGWRLSRHLK